MSAANALSSNHPLKGTPQEPRAADPSMEDILASIRRIIADDHSRTVAAATGSYRRAAPQNVTPPVRIEPGAPSIPVDLGPGLIEPPQGFDVLPPRPADLAEAPRVTIAEPEPVAAMPHLNPPVIPAAIEDDLAVIADIVTAGAAAILESPAALLKPSPAPVVQAPAAEARAPQPGPLPIEPAAEPIVLSLDGYEAPSEAVRTAAALPPTQPAEPLVSASAGASIETSFQALATSVFLQNAGAVDAMTREMLRPMLKTWLDDNLPTIVERLVRAEIERVARGVRS